MSVLRPGARLVRRPRPDGSIVPFTMGPNTFIPLTNDALFHVFFARHERLLLLMLEAVLGRKLESLTVLNPSLPGDVSVSKVIVLDVLVKPEDGSRVDIEIQVQVTGRLKSRLVYYGCRNFTQQLVRGDDYEELLPSVVVVWMVEPLFPEAEAFHSVYELRERRTGRPFSADLGIHVLELSKLGLAAGPAGEGYEELARQWGQLFLAKTELELARIAEQNETMSEAVKALYETSADPEVAAVALRRDESRKFYQIDLALSRREGREEGREEGRSAGEQEGLERGRQRQRVTLGKQLRLRFQLESLPSAVEQRLEAATSDELSLWAERIFSATTLDDVFA